MSSRVAPGRLSAPGPRAARTGWRLTACSAAGIGVGLAAAQFARPGYAPAIGWDAAAGLYCLWIWLAIWPMNAAATAAKARAEDPSRAVSDIIALAACVASIGVVGIVLTGAHAAHGAAAGLLAGLGLTSVAVSWLTVHTIFTLRYAVQYYAEPVGGVDFHSADPPRYQDFAYLAVTVGTTFQISDTDVQVTGIRVTVLRHCLLAYLFGAVIIASTVNLIASL